MRMLELAQKKAEAAGVMMELAQADMMALEGIGDFDAVTCYSDSLCYMADQEAVYRSLKEFTLFSIKVVLSFLTFTPFIKWRKCSEL